MRACMCISCIIRIVFLPVWYVCVVSMCLHSAAQGVMHSVENSYNNDDDHDVMVAMIAMRMMIGVLMVMVKVKVMVMVMAMAMVTM